MGSRYYSVTLYTENKSEKNSHSFPEDEVDGMEEAAKKARDSDNLLKNRVVGAKVKLKDDEASPREGNVVKENDFNLK